MTGKDCEALALMGACPDGCEDSILLRVMKNLWQKYQAWRERKRHKRLAWWGRKREMGKPLFVLWTTIVWAGWMSAYMTLAEYYIKGSIRSEGIFIKLIVYSIGGFFLALFTWHDNERAYQKSLKANPDAACQPR